MSGAAEDCEDGKAVFFYIALKKRRGELPLRVSNNAY